MCGLVRCLLLLLLLPLLLPPLLRGQEELKGPHFARTHRVFCCCCAACLKNLEREGEQKNIQRSSPQQMLLTFFSVCFARRTAYVTLWNIMLQMPINRIQRIAEKEAGEEDGGRASCAAGVHNTHLLAQVEDIW